MTTMWTNRDNVDPADWSNRRVTSAPAIVGSGSNGFTVFSMFMDGVIFWSPRYVRFGDIYGGSDEWSKRVFGTTSWSRR